MSEFNRTQFDRVIHLKDIGPESAKMAETVRAFMEYGLSSALLQRALKLTDASIRNLSTGRVKRPHPGTKDTIEDLRFTISVLDHTGMEPDDTISWLTSRHRENIFFRPIDDIYPYPDEVLNILPLQFGTHFESKRFPGEEVYIGALSLNEPRAYYIEDGTLHRVTSK